MRKYCQTLVITPEDYSQELHKQVYVLRHRHKKTYKEISETLSIKLELVSFYVRTDPTKPWVLSDWITGYHVKDSSVYEKIDFLVDCDQKLVERFKRAGRSANYVEKV